METNVIIDKYIQDDNLNEGILTKMLDEMSFFMFDVDVWAKKTKNKNAKNLSSKLVKKWNEFKLISKTVAKEMAKK